MGRCWQCKSELRVFLFFLVYVFVLCLCVKGFSPGRHDPHTGGAHEFGMMCANVVTAFLKCPYEEAVACEEDEAHWFQ